MLFNERDYKTLHGHVFDMAYPGFKPEVREAPHGDGRVDAQKRYAHVATKYKHPSQQVHNALQAYLAEAHLAAGRVANMLKVPDAFLPRLEYGALRVLEYPVGAGGHEHTDFDLFTITLYRNSLMPFRTDSTMSSFITMGEIGEAVGLGKANLHHVEPSDRVQHSIVYFAIPDHDAVLPIHGGVTVGEWINERIARSRVPVMGAA